MKIAKPLLTLLLLGMMGVGGAFAQTVQPNQTFTFHFIPGEDMFYIPWRGNGGELNRLYSLVDEYRTEITAGRMPIYVDGYCASLPTENEKRYTAFVRANRVKSELITNKEVAEGNFVTKNYTTAYTAPDGKSYRDMVVVTLRILTKEQPRQPEPMREETATVVQEEPRREEPPLIVQSEPVAEPEPQPEQQPQQQQATDPLAGLMADPVALVRPYYFAVRTNLLYDAFLLPTLGVEWRANRSVGVKLDVSGSYWGNEKGKVQKMWLVSPEVRWYLLDSKRLYVSAGANIGEYNIYKGMLGSLFSGDTGYQGKLWNAGVTVGYQLRLNRSLSLDFNLGLGYTRLEYDSFTVSNETRVFKERGKTKNFWGPTQAGVNLIWTIGGNK